MKKFSHFRYDSYRTAVPELLDQGDHWELLTHKMGSNSHYNEFPRLISKGKPLCVILGESAASGFFYRPTLTLGKLIQHALGDDYQILDLSVVGLAFDEMVKFAPMLKALTPKYLVVFAGNNIPQTFNPGEEEQFFLSVLAPLRKALGKEECHFFFPEFHHLGWQPQEIASIDLGQQLFLRRLKRKTQLEPEEWVELAGLAEERCPTVQYLIGRHWSETGETDRAQVAFRQQHESYLGFEHLSPRSFPVDAAHLEATLKSEGFKVSYLAKTSSSWRLMDYCHPGLGAMIELVNHAFGSRLCLADVSVDHAQAHWRAFAHCLSYGQYPLALAHLSEVEHHLGSDAFHRRLTHFLAVIFSGAPLATHVDYLMGDGPIGELPHGPVTDALGKVCYPERWFYLKLRSLGAQVPQSVVKHTELNLLQAQRFRTSAMYLLEKIFFAPYLQPIGFDPLWCSRFLRSELAHAQSYVVCLSLEFHFPATRLELWLNDRCCQTFELESAHFKRELQFSQEAWEEYNQFELRLTFTYKEVNEDLRRQGLYRIHRFSLKALCNHGQ